MIQQVKIKNKNYPFLYSLRANYEGNLLPQDLNEIELSYRQIYLGFKYGAMYDGKEFEYSYEDFEKILETDPDVYRRSAEVFFEHVEKLTGGMAVDQEKK